jgi:hypothetical protein
MVELYLYSPYGPYGLYRASVPVQGCALPFFYLRLVGHRKEIRNQDLLNWKQNAGRVKMYVNPYLTTNMKVNIHTV